MLQIFNLIECLKQTICGAFIGGRGKNMSHDYDGSNTKRLTMSR